MSFQFTFKRKARGKATDTQIRDAIKADLRSLNRKLVKELGEVELELQVEFEAD